MTKIEKDFNERPQGALPSNNIPNPREDIKVITTRSGITLVGLFILSPNSSSSSQGVERNPGVTGPWDSFAKALAQMLKYAMMLKDLLTNKEKLLELANTPLNENCSAVLLKKLPGETCKFTFPADFVVIDYDVDPLVPLSLGRPFLRTARALVDLYGEEMTLRVGDEKLIFNKSIHILSGCLTPSSDPVVASLSPSLTPFGDSDFLLEETDAFVALDDSIPPEIDNEIYDSEGDILFLEKLLNDDPTKDLPPKELNDDETKTTKSLIKEPPELELKDLLPPRSLGVSPATVVPKKGGMKVVTNDNNKLIPTRLVTGWRVCIDYRKLNDATGKDHFSLPFMDQMLERLAGNEFYYLLDGFFGMPFGLCNAPGTFQRCMVAIFHDMIEKTMKVFMDDFSVFGDSFFSRLSYLNMMLKRCEDTNLVLNKEKCYFMVKDGIVLGHKISKNGIEVDKGKVDVIAKLPPPMTVNEYESF
ncbi:reverse transcriptase domain-containing protein [Tanacetum coccineum]